MKGRSALAFVSMFCLIVAAAIPLWNITRPGLNAAPPTGAPSGRDGQVLNAYANLPLAFVENRGQVDSRVRYYAQGPRYAFSFMPDAVGLSFLKGNPSPLAASQDARAGVPLAAPLDAQQPPAEGVTLNLRFVGGNARTMPEAQQRTAGASNYLLGNDPARWQTGVPSYAQVVYHEVWPGVDVLLHGQGHQLKYEFRLRPGARPADIRLSYAGADALALDDTGGLQIATAMGTLRDAPPISYQEIAGARVPVDSSFVLGGDGVYGFALGAGYDPSQELIIDPGVDYSTLLGGASDDIGAGIAVDAAGNAYIAGTTQSPDFPTTPGAFKRTGATSNFSDVFVTKLNAAGTALVYSTFIGGNDFDWGRGIAIDAAGNAYITGQTKSPSFPTTGGAFDRTFNVDTCPRCGIDQYDAFALKLNAAGSALVYSTFLGGFDIDDGLGIAVDAAGSAYVTGETGSANFPTTAGAFDSSKNGAFDAFVTKLNPTGSALAYSTYLGGTAVEFGSRVAVDSGGAAYVMGSTSSADLPTTPGAFDTSANGAFDVFVTKLAANGATLAYSTYLGGSDFDSGGGLKLDAAGNAYIVGSTGSANFPTTPGAFDTAPAGDAFITKLNAAGSALVYSTGLGGAGSEGANGVAIDAAGNAWVTGSTNSSDFPISADGFDTSFNGSADAFITQVNATGAAVLYSTYLGGGNSESGSDLARDSAGNIYITGHTYSLDFPTTVGALDIVFNGDLSIFWGDGFVTKLNISRTTSTPPSTPPVPAAPTLVAPTNGDTPPQPITFQWNTVGGAASYTIQIDDSSAFTAPLVREQIGITGLMYATTDLATTQHFWRVRAVNTAGVPGAWSAVRSFTPQAAPPPPTLSTFSTNPATVVGGNSSSGTVVLSSGAPHGGALISLTSSNPAVASVPASVTAPENSFTGTFVITTAPVAANTLVTITAAYNGTTRTATLNVTPATTATTTPTPIPPATATPATPPTATPIPTATPAAQPTATPIPTATPPPAGPLPAPALVSPAADARFTPGQSITFDWGDVAGAAGYTIQIDDSQSFAAPLTLEQATSASQYTTSTLPTTRMWWRVRANDAAGTPGAWSASRRFEVKQ